MANVDLWEPLIELVVDRVAATFRWVKGHSGDPMNDLVDALAVAASKGPFTARGRTVAAGCPRPRFDLRPLTAWPVECLRPPGWA